MLCKICKKKISLGIFQFAKFWHLFDVLIRGQNRPSVSSPGCPPDQFYMSDHPPAHPPELLLLCFQPAVCLPEWLCQSLSSPTRAPEQLPLASVKAFALQTCFALEPYFLVFPLTCFIHLSPHCHASYVSSMSLLLSSPQVAHLKSLSVCQSLAIHPRSLTSLLSTCRGIHPRLLVPMPYNPKSNVHTSIHFLLLTLGEVTVASGKVEYSRHSSTKQSSPALFR